MTEDNTEATTPHKHFFKIERTPNIKKRLTAYSQGIDGISFSVEKDYGNHYLMKVHGATEDQYQLLMDRIVSQYAFME